MQVRLLLCVIWTTSTRHINETEAYTFVIEIRRPVAVHDAMVVRP